MLFLILS